MFRRRRRGDAEPGYDSGAAQEDPELYGDPDELGELGEDEDEHDGEVAASGSGGQWDSETGPWDGAGSYPERDRIDFGSLLVPMYDGIEIEVKVAEGVGVWITVRRGDSTIELMAFAAPKTSGLWDEVRQEFADEVANAGGSSEEAQGPFGVELHARLHPGGEGRRGQLEPVRFLGVDGSRWFLRGMIRGRRRSARSLLRRLRNCSPTSSSCVENIRLLQGTCWRSGCRRTRSRHSRKNSARSRTRP